MKISLAVRKRRQRGMGALETLVSLSCLALILLSFITLSIHTARTGASVVSQCNTSLDAVTSVQEIELALREARRFELMDGGTYGTTYDSVDASGNIIAVAGIHIVFPAARSTSVNIVTTSAGATTTLSGATALVNVASDGNYLDVYRSDTSGNPAPSNGTCLWVKGTMNGGALPAAGRALVKDIANWDGAVQFIQPYAPGSTTPLKNQVVIKITTGAWDRIETSITSDSRKGTVTSLTGEHIFLRNHDPNGASSGAAHGKTQYSGG